ncbi:hypothetical protein D1007_34429 [Hordeum vulgare]|nr:hypothetical protein D1007_34429 [Hordeum vulgare]
MLNRGWEREELNDSRLVPVLARLGKLRRAGVTMAMVVQEFICRRIAPLQHHSRPMWAYTGPNDSMRIQVRHLSPDVLRELLRWLTSDDPSELPLHDLPLYSLKAPGTLVAGMPLFDEWGLLSGGGASPAAPTPGVQARGDSGHAVRLVAGVSGASPSTRPILDPRRARVGGGGRSTVEVASPASKHRSRTVESPC